MSMTEERCIFPHSNNSIFTPIRDFPWYTIHFYDTQEVNCKLICEHFACRHEERYGSSTLPWKKWILAKDLPEDPDEVKKVRASFREMVRKMIVGRQLRMGITVC